MGWKDRVKGVLFVDEGGTKSSATPATVTTNSFRRVASSPVSPVSVAVTGDVADEKFLGLLTRTIDGASDPVWQQFAGLLDSLGGIIKDEAMLYQAAFKAGEGQGLTLATLETAAAGRLELLKREQQKFEKDLSAKAENDVPAREEQIAQIDQQLATLQVQMNQLQRQRESTLHEMTEAKSRLGHAKQKFESAQATLKTQLEQQLARIRTHLK